MNFALKWPDKKLLDLLGINHPIIQAPMAGVSTPELIASVSNTGALGSYGTTGIMNAEHMFSAFESGASAVQMALHFYAALKIILARLTEKFYWKVNLIILSL